MHHSLKRGEIPSSVDSVNVENYRASPLSSKSRGPTISCRQRRAICISLFAATLSKFAASLFSTKRVDRREKKRLGAAIFTPPRFERTQVSQPCGRRGMKKINVGTTSAESTRRAVWAAWIYYQSLIVSFDFKLCARVSSSGGMKKMQKSQFGLLLCVCWSLQKKNRRAVGSCHCLNKMWDILQLCCITERVKEGKKVSRREPPPRAKHRKKRETESPASLSQKIAGIQSTKFRDQWSRRVNQTQLFADFLCQPSAKYFLAYQISQLNMWIFVILKFAYWLGRAKETFYLNQFIQSTTSSVCCSASSVLGAIIRFCFKLIAIFVSSPSIKFVNTILYAIWPYIVYSCKYEVS